jgi:hypothetical protein
LPKWSKITKAPLVIDNVSFSNSQSNEWVFNKLYFYRSTLTKILLQLSKQLYNIWYKKRIMTP